HIHPVPRPLSRGSAAPVAENATASHSAASGPSAEALLSLALDRVREWAPGGTLRTVVLAGSLARGEGVWARTKDGPRLLSDIDLYAIVRDEPAAARARLAARMGMPGLLADAGAGGLGAPIDLGWLGERELAGVPARPGTLELPRARGLWGDAAMLERVPRHTARDIPAEEILLLIENRGA